MKDLRKKKSLLGGQDRAQFSETTGLRGRLELSKESSCHGHRSRKKREGCEVSAGQDHASTNSVGTEQKAVKGYDGS